MTGGTGNVGEVIDATKPIKKPGNVNFPFPRIRQDLKAIARKRASLHGATGPQIGTYEELAGGGTVQKYENGNLYWHGGDLVWYVHGAILAKYEELGGTGSFLGYPTSDEHDAGDHQGRFNEFEHGSIIWHPATGAWEIHGAIRDEWRRLGAHTSYLGYPISDEQPWAGDKEKTRISRFQRGSIGWIFGSEIQDLPDAVVYEQQLKTGAAVTGNHTLTINSKGKWAFTGHWHNSGGIDLNADMAVTFNVPSSSGEAIIFSVDALLKGTFPDLSPGEKRNYNWEQYGEDEKIKHDWDLFKSCGIYHNFDAGANPGAIIAITLEAVFAVAAIFAAGKTATGKICAPIAGNEGSICINIVDKDETCPPGCIMQ